MDKPTVLWHGGFHDHPLNGLASYKDKKVWLEVSDDQGCIQIKNEAELKALDPYYYDVHDDEMKKEEDGSYYCWKYTLYKLYEMPDEYFKQFEESHKLFQELVGYHTDHDPLIYNPFCNPFSKFNDIEQPRINYHPYNYDCLGEFRSIDFINYHVPRRNYQ